MGNPATATTKSTKAEVVTLVRRAARVLPEDCLIHTLTRRDQMVTRKRVFISFDYDHDDGAKIMLAGQAKHEESPFDFTDASVKEPLVGDWKEKVKRRMDNIDVVIVLCGEKTHTATGVAAELTIAQAKLKPYFLLAAYPDKTCTAPTTAKSTDKTYKWTWPNLKALIGGAR
jgi:hypothetical protein